MWKKDEEQGSARVTGEKASPPIETKGRASVGGIATIGRSIHINGEVTGSEDLVIHGTVEGSVSLAEHSVSIGSDGQVSANVSGRVITVDGTVTGDLTANDQIVLRGTARVQGDLKAPRLVLEDGATFRGLVDMGSARKKETKPEADAPASRLAAAKGPKPASKPETAGKANGSTKVEASPSG